MPKIATKKTETKQAVSASQKIDKIYQDFLLKVAKIEKERDLKISKIIKKAETEKIKKISASFKR
ncbi:MAG: hypothetical protein WC441_02165 [Patescibacteria group bacterium]